MTTPTLVQSRCNSFTAGAAATYGGNVFQGAQTKRNSNYCIVASSWTTTQPSMAVADTTNGAYALRAAFTDATNKVQIGIFVKANIAAAAAAANTLTVTFGSVDNQFPDIIFFELGGADPANSIDGFASANGNSALASSGNFVSRILTELGVGYAYAGNDATGPGTGWTAATGMTNGAGGGITNQGGLLETRALPTPSSLAATIVVGSGIWDAIGFSVPPPGSIDVNEFGSAA